MKTRVGALGEWKAGWPLPFVSALGVTMVNMPAYSLGMFFAPLERDLGWTRAQAASGLLALSIVAVLVIPVMGRLVDLKGARRIALPGLILFCLAFAALGLAQPPIWTWWALWILLALAGASVSPVVWTSAVASRFDKGRGLALAIALSGSGIGAALAPLLSDALIGPYGWRLAYTSMGAIFALSIFPLAFFLFFSARDLDRRPVQNAIQHSIPIVSGMSVGEALRDRRFLQLAVATFLIAFALMGLVVHFVPIVTSLGLSKTTAAEAAAFVGIGSITGRLLAGSLLDRFHGPIVGSCVFSLPILVVLAFTQGGGNAQFVFPIAFLLGISLGSEVDVVAYLTSRYVGMKNFGSLFGISVSAMALGTGVGPWAAGLAFDHYGSYDYLLIAVMPLFLMAAFLVASLGAYPQYEDDRQPAG